MKFHVLHNRRAVSAAIYNPATHGRTVEIVEELPGETVLAFRERLRSVAMGPHVRERAYDPFSPEAERERLEANPFWVEQ